MRACEVALDVARAQAASRDGGPLPRAIRPLLGFRGRALSGAALSTVRQVLDDDEEFRALVAAEATDSTVGRAGRLFLDRPDGWSEELAALVAAEQELAERDRERAVERAAERKVGQLEKTVAELSGQLADARATVASAGDALDAERRHRRAAESESADLRRRLDRAETARRDAVSDLVEARRLAEERLEVTRALERRVGALERARARLTEPVADAVARAGGALDVVRSELEAALDLLRRDPVDPNARSDADEAADVGSAPRGRARRTPLRLARGAIDGTFEATDQLLRAPGSRIVVDGYNVSMQGWPHLDARTQRERLVGLLSGVSARVGAQVHVVFDGDDDGRRPSVGAALAVRVHYTPAGVEADDVVISMVDEFPPSCPVVVISSDHRVRDGARAAGANVVSSEALLAWDRR